MEASCPSRSVTKEKNRGLLLSALPAGFGPAAVAGQSQAGWSVQLVDEGVDDHEADEDGENPEHP